MFEQQIRFLRENGYSSITLGEAVNSIGAHKNRPKTVVITFDDGFRDFYTEACPVLLRYGFSATVFVVTALAGGSQGQFHGKDCLSWKEIRELRSQGIEFGSHTVNHPELEFMEPAAIEDEISQSKQAIEDQIGEPVRSFAYPYAFPELNFRLTSFLARTLERLGYQNGVSTILGTAHAGSNRFFLPRLPVNTWDDSRLFQAKLEGGYDWLHLPQRIYKAVKNPAQSEGKAAGRKTRAESACL
jgi:peptidoglycan/xylan/chitin deacetylase (PgdA/CDA1 family)